MKISRISLEGFRGVLEPLTIECGMGFTVICGRNGTGKSTICDAVEFMLHQTLEFRQATERGEYIENYFWWRGRPAARHNEVAITFVNSQDKGLSLECTPAGSTDDVSQLVDVSSAPENWRDVLALTTVLRDETIIELSTDRPERERYDFALRAIGLASSARIERTISSTISILDARKENAQLAYERERSKVETWTSELSAARIAAAKTSRENLDDLNRKYSADLRGGLTDFAQLARTIAQRIAQDRNRIDSLESLRAAKASLDRRKAGIITAEFSEKVDSLRNTRDDLQRTFQSRKEAHEALRVELHKERDQSPELTALATLREQGAQIGLRDGKCPLCGSAITAGQFDSHLSEIQKQLNRVSEAIARTVGAEDNARRELDSARQQLEQAEQAYRELQVLGDELARQETQLSGQAKRIGIELEETSLSHEMERLSKEIVERNQDLAVVEAFAALHRVTELEQLLEGARKSADEAEQTLRGISVAQSTAADVKAAANRVSGEIVRERLSSLKPLFLEMYERLRPHRFWTDIDFLLRGDVRPFLSFVVGGELNPRFMFSSGQRRALGLAFLLSVHLSRSWCNLETLILDDVVQHVDDYRALNFVETLASVRKSGRQVICTVEDPALADLLCRRLRSAPADGVRVDLDFSSEKGVHVTDVQRLGPMQSVLAAAD